MLATFLLGLAAGWFAEKAEPRVKAGIESVLLTDAPITPIELRVVSFALCLLAAALASMVFGDPHAFVLAAGGALGVLGPRLTAKYRQSRNPDYDE
ncbi:MAG: hypothetical protein AAF871_13715 [Pseudomonadota bacterium]